MLELPAGEKNGPTASPFAHYPPPQDPQTRIIKSAAANCTSFLLILVIAMVGKKIVILHIMQFLCIHTEHSEQ